MTQDGSLDLRLVMRVCHLQQALDQALSSLDELRSQAQAKSLLELQLAETEQFASVQKQAIAQLQNQFERQSRTQVQALQNLMTDTEIRVQDQRVELERLRVWIQRSQAEIQTYLIRLKQKCQTPNHTIDASEQSRLDLESEVSVARMLAVSLGSQLDAARQHTQSLSALLSRHQEALGRLRLEPSLRAEATPEANNFPPQSLDHKPSLNPESIPGSLQTPDSEVIEAPESKLALIPDPPVESESISAATSSPEAPSTQLRVAEIEAELTEQFKLQTRLKHHCQELAVERDHYKHRAEELEQQNIKLQKQILQQINQVKDYAAAMQYWKDLYTASH